VDLSAKVALVTGGAKRVGRAIALELAHAGCDVAVHCRRPSLAEAEELVREVRGLGRGATATAGDLTDSATWPEIIRQTVESLGRLDILINNASMFLTEAPDRIDAFELRLWDTMLRTNVVAPAALCHHAAPYLRANGAGRIVNLCDIASERPWPKNLAYCVSKAALVALTKGLARALAPEVLVNGVAPGIAVFPDDYPVELRQELTRQVPLARDGTPQEVAAVVRFLVESGDYITGQVIPIDGGRSLV
jgi:NAD(P)-dependent dehydrogenase (short-subunit alcohol dehydrogenase family)